MFTAMAGGRPTLYIHAGAHKAGSTAIQRFLFENAEALAQRGVIRPRTGLRAQFGVKRPRGGVLGRPDNWAHDVLAWSLRRDDAGDVWGELADELRGARTAIVSSEAFEDVRLPFLYEVIQRALPNWRIRIIFYARQQADALASAYNLHVRGGKTLTIDQFWKRRMRRRLDYASYLDAVSAVFGRAAIDLRVYEQACEGGLHRDLCDAIGVRDTTGLTAPPEDFNASLPPWAIQLLARLNRCLKDAPDKRADMHNRVIEKYRGDKQPHRDLIGAERREAIRRFYAASNARLSRLFYGGSPLF